MKDTLITGGTGMVGQALSGGRKISSKDCDLTDARAVEELFQKLKPKKVIHCAARLGGIVGNMKYRAQFFRDNLLMNINVIEACRKYNVEKLLLFSSTCVFPDKCEYPITVDQMHQGRPHDTNYGYGFAKRMGHVMLETYREQYGLPYISVIPTNIYGENDLYDIENGHVVASLIAKFHKADLEGTDVVCWGNGSAMREFIYVGDVAKIVEHLMKTYNDPEPVILSPTASISIMDLAKLIKKIMNFKGRILWDMEMPNGQLKKPSDNSLLLDLMEGVGVGMDIKHVDEDGKFKFTSIEDGLRRAILWYDLNHSTARTKIF